MALKSDLFKGALMLLPSIFTGGIGLFGFGKMFKGVLDLPGISAVALANHRTRQQALRKVEGDPSLSVESVFLNNLETQIKTPADLDGETLNALFHGLEEVPITIQFPEVRTDLTIDTRINTQVESDLLLEFNTLAYEDIFSSWVDQEILQDVRFESIQSQVKEIQTNYRQVGFEKSKKEMRQLIENTLTKAIENGELHPSSACYNDPFGTTYEDPNYILVGVRPGRASGLRDARRGRGGHTHDITSEMIYLSGRESDAQMASIKTQIQNHYSVGTAEGVKVELVYLDPEGNKIPDNMNHHTWLKQKGYDPKIAEILVVPERILSKENGKFDEGEWKKLNEDLGDEDKKPSPYLPDAQKFYNDLKDIFLSNNIISTGKKSDVSEIIAPTDTDSTIAKILTNLKNGRTFDIDGGTLLKWYVETQFKIKEKYENGVITQAQRENSLSKIESLFSEQFELYGYKKDNPLYFPVKFTVYSIMRMIYRKVTSLPMTTRGYSARKFKEEIMNPNYDYYATDPEFKPNTKTWEKLIKPTREGDGEKIKKFLVNIGATDQEITDVMDKVIPIVNQYIEKVKIEIKAKGLWEGIPKTPRLKVLREIIDCPATDALKLIESRTDFSKLFFNHPVYDQEGGKWRISGMNYVDGIFLDKDSFSRVSTFLPLLVRTSSLTLKDFEKIGLDVSKAEMKAIKEHVFKIVYQNLKDNDYFNLNKRPIKYQNERTVRALFLAISKLHIATALHENDPFIDIKDTKEYFYSGKDRYSNYFTSSLPSANILNHYALVIQDLIAEEVTMESLISGSYMTGNIPFYLDALAALENLKMQMDLSRRVFHGMRRTQTTINGYLSLWYKNRYKAWTTIVLGRETLFTEVLSFESLDDSLFNKNFGGRVFQTQHMKRNNKQSCSLYHLLLTNNNYHKTLEDTMSATDQRILKSGVATLVEMGLSGEGSGPNGEITTADIEYVFSDSQGYPILFGVKSRKTGNNESGIPILTTYDKDGNKIHGLWDYHFSHVPFNDKLKIFNEKIENYRLALETFKGSSNSNKKAFLEFLKTSSYNNLRSNFYDKAENFANELDAWAHINPKIAKLAPLRRITRYYTDDAKILFKIEQLKTFITLDKFL